MLHLLHPHTGQLGGHVHQVPTWGGKEAISGASALLIVVFVVVRSRLPMCTVAEDDAALGLASMSFCLRGLSGHGVHSWFCS